MDVKKALEKRYSTRSFRSEKRVRLRDVYSVMDAVVHAPMAGGINTIKLVLVEDAGKITQIANAAPESEFISDVKYLIVVCSDLKQAEKMHGAKGVKEHTRYQAGAAVQSMLLS